MLTLSTVLAQATEKVEQKLPPQYAKYTKVFNEPKDRELPPWWPFDHGIDLKETFVPKVAKTYYYSTRGPYFIFPHFPYQLYTSFPFLLQWLRSCSLSRLSQRSRHPDLDLQYDFPSWWTILFHHTSLYSMVVFHSSIYSKNRYLPNSPSYCSPT